MHTPPELLRWGARRHPDLDALRDEHSAISYGELDRRTNALANGLAGMGVQPGDRVAILDKNSAAYLELMLALGKAGPLRAPVNSRPPPPQARPMGKDAGPPPVVTGDPLCLHPDAC